MVCTVAQLGASTNEGWFGGFTGGAGSYLVADESTLRDVADATGGEYFAAADAGELQSVLDDLPQTVATQREDIEISAWLVGLAALALAGAVWAAARWTAFP